MEARIGCSGWFYWHWKGIFYPEAITTRDWFAHYRRRFNTVELNAPFYSWPKLPTVKQWVRQANPGLRYCIKVNGQITHERRFQSTKTLVRDFYFIAEVLGPHMGCFLFQCPPSFHYTPTRLRLILEQLDPVHRNAVEFRHRSWWRGDVFQKFKSHGLLFCSVSAPRLPADLVKTAPDIYVRFHGTRSWYRHEYTAAELKPWADAISSSQAETAWILFNNDFQCHAITNARQLRRMLQRKEK
jgi:uncharacterized protein YecE (DUF72 family)